MTVHLEHNKNPKPNNYSEESANRKRWKKLVAGRGMFQSQLGKVEPLTPLLSDKPHWQDLGREGAPKALRAHLNAPA